MPYSSCTEAATAVELTRYRSAESAACLSHSSSWPRRQGKGGPFQAKSQPVRHIANVGPGPRSEVPVCLVEPPSGSVAVDDLAARSPDAVCPATGAADRYLAVDLEPGEHRREKRKGRSVMPSQTWHAVEPRRPYVEIRKLGESSRRVEE